MDKKNSTQRWCITFSKLEEVFNTILTLFSNAWCFHPSLIHVSHLLSHFFKLYNMHENLTFIIRGVALSHSTRLIFNSWFVRIGELFIVKFHKISAALRIGLQVRDMKAVTFHRPRHSRMDLKNKLKCWTSKFRKI